LKIKLPLLLLIALLNSSIYSKSDSLYFFTSDVLFVPTKAGIFESRTGVTKFTDKKNLKLDIGVSFDVIGLNSGIERFSVGVDFFTFSNLRSEQNFKFPVDAIDYLFGINLNYKKHISLKNNLALRFRLSHISSHLQDGHIYERSDTIFKPFVFSKEFINLAIVNEYSVNNELHLKSMLGIDYIFHSIPGSISKLSGQLGLEARYFLTDILSLYVSNDLVLASVNSKSNLNENFESGITLGKLNSRSISLYYTFYDGQDYRGQYYGSYLNYNGIGGRIEF